jgi:hypothetical protein
MGVTVERYNLAQQPLAFVQNAAVRALLDQDGTEALPAIFIDGELASKGTYPAPSDGAAWLARAQTASAQ